MKILVIEYRQIGKRKWRCDETCRIFTDPLQATLHRNSLNYDSKFFEYKVSVYRKFKK